MNVIDVVVLGNSDFFKIKEEKEVIYVNFNVIMEDYIYVGELEEKFGVFGGWIVENDV